MLLPKFYFPEIQKKYEIGIIPHFVDKNNKFLRNFSGYKNILIIDVEQKNSLNFINNILQCKKIFSSSLHGLIVSDAYSIPSIWIKLSDDIKGNDFKFYDYFESVGRMDEKPFVFTSSLNIDEIGRASCRERV